MMKIGLKEGTFSGAPPSIETSSVLIRSIIALAICSETLAQMSMTLL